jgi:PEP-CTERM motif
MCFKLYPATRWSMQAITFTRLISLRKWGAGGTFQLRFAEADNQLFFQLGVDRVSVDFTAVPEPGTVTLLLGGLLTVLGIRVRRRC